MPVTDTNAPPLILASASRSRAALLRAAGLMVDIVPADIDETAIKNDCLAAGNSVQDVARRLAHDKALKISKQNPEALIIGADQMLECDGRWFDKPVDIADAAASLRALRGKTHALVTSVSVVQNQREVWGTTERAQLAMRDFSDGFLEQYLSSIGDDALLSVGAYQLEGLGAQLFEHIEGDYFTILGLPLLSLMGFLREQDQIAT